MIIAIRLLSLDFLRKSRELSEWYGPGFFFVANPLMLPMNVFSCFDKVLMRMMMMMIIIMMIIVMIMMMSMIMIIRL